MKCYATALKAHEAWLRGEPDGAPLDLSGEDLTGVDFAGANLAGANLYRANLRRTNMTDANLSGANLYRANLYRANLTGADLTGADLYRANLTDANLTGADLYRADLYRANLSGANLYRANLSGANLAGRATLYTDTQREYVLYVIPEAGRPMFIAGCRTLTLAQAREHWGADSERSQPEYIAAIERWVTENTSQTAAGAGSTV